MTVEHKDSDERDARKHAVECYDRVVADAEIKDIRLIDLSFFVRPEYYSFSSNDSDSKGKLKRRFGCIISDCYYDEPKRILGGQFDWSITVLKANKKLLSVKAKYLLIYGNVPDVDTQHSFAFIKKVGRFATYPYFRNIVAQLSWESHADLPVMPVLK